VKRATAKSGRIKDAFGVWSDISEFRGTRHGFDVILGWPSGKRRGTGGAGRPRVILTPALVRYVERFRMNMKGIDLPISPKVIVRLRGLLGHHKWNEMRRWWEDHKRDLKTLTYVEFSKRYGRTPSAARHHGARLNGRRNHPNFWWIAPDVLAILSSQRPDAEVAAVLDVSPTSVRRMRSQCRKKKGPWNPASFPLRRGPCHWWRNPLVLNVLMSGLKYRKLAGVLGIPMGSLCWIISQSRQAGLGPRRRSRERGRTWYCRTPKVRALLASGRPDVEIAAELGIVRSSVRRLRGKLRKESLGAESATG
jgi:hypothetical protein